jgi:transcriptional regulator GlxA family with amidase domain
MTKFRQILPLVCHTKTVRRIVFVGVPPVQILDITGPIEVFAQSGDYRVDLVSSSRVHDLQSSCGFAISNIKYYARIHGPVDTLLVAGGVGAESARCDEKFLEWLFRMGHQSRRLGSICTGAFLLARAGLLEGKRVVTHWEWCDKLKQQHPSIQIERNPVYIKDGRVYTSAGITAGIDLALALVEEDHGRERALKIARKLVMFLVRPGGQAQFSTVLSSQTGARTFSELQVWLLEHLADHLTVDVLAERVCMSPRHFARVFLNETGTTPARFVEGLRVEAAQRMLEHSSGGLKEIALACGFGSTDSMRRSFLRVLEVTAADYSKRFSR